MPRTHFAACTLALAAGGAMSAAPTHAQNLFVANFTGSANFSGSISEFTTSGGTPSPIGQVFTDYYTANGIFYPDGIAFDAKGDLFVANVEGGPNSQGSITEFVASSGTLNPIGQTFAFSTSTNGLALPSSLAFDSDGNLFVSNRAHSITEFTASGGTLNSTGQVFAASSAQFEPYGLAFDSGGNLFVANQTGGSGGAGTITEFASTDGTLSSTGQTFALGNTTNELSGPLGLAFDSAGNLFATNGSGITEFIASGGTLSPTGQVFATGNAVNGLFNPQRLAFDAQGNLFVTNQYGTASPSSGSISEFTVSSGILNPSGQIFASADSTNGLNYPIGLAFSPTPRAAVVPESSPFALFALGLLPVGLIARRQKKA